MKEIAPRSFRYERSASGVAQITLARPDRLNSLTFEVYEELSDVLLALDAHDEVRSLVITGEGPRTARASAA